MFSLPRLFTFLISFCCATISMAGEGWYVGAGALYTDLMADLTYKETRTGTTLLQFGEHSNHEEFGGQVHAGYQWLIPLSLGLASFAVEVAGEFQSNTLTEVHPSIPPAVTSPFSVEMTLGDSVLITAKPGYFITNNIMVYAEVGPIYSQFRDIKSDSGTRANSGYIQYGDYGNTELWGIRAGAGINFLVTKLLTIEAGWRYTGYSDFSEKMTIIPSSGTTANFTVDDINTEQAYLGLHYYFG